MSVETVADVVAWMRGYAANFNLYLRTNMTFKDWLLLCDRLEAASKHERDAFGRFYCECRGRYVALAATIYTAEHRAHLFNADKCAPDCPHRAGKTRRAIV